MGKYSGRERPPSSIAMTDPAAARGSFTPRLSVSVLSRIVASDRAADRGQIRAKNARRIVS
jgi:hypothetical protein